MKKLLSGQLMFAVLLMGCLAVTAQDEDKDAAAQQAMMKHMMPGPEHTLLAGRAGDWKTTMTFWMEPGAPPSTGSGTTHYEMILGGRVLKGTHKMEMEGMPMIMNGLSLESYDNTRKLFNMIWTDDLATGLTYGEGKFDNHTMTTTGKMADPMKGGEVDFRTVTKVVNKDKEVMEMYLTSDGPEFKIFEVVYERVP
jgi:hypothetical protein